MKEPTAAPGSTLEDLQITLSGYSDADLTNWVVDQVYTAEGDSAGRFPTLGTWYDAAFVSAAPLPSNVNFLKVTVRKFGADFANYSWDIGDLYLQEADFASAVIDVLDAGAITTPAWTAASFGTGWQDYNAAVYQACASCKDSAGFVHLRGVAKTTTVPDATARAGTLMTLPALHRPAKIVVAPCRVNLSPVSFGTITIDTSGVVKLDGYTVAQPEAAVGLDSITFDTR